MIQPKEVKDLVARAFPDAEVTVQDMTGTRDHYQIHVVSSTFRDRLLLDQHRMVQAAVQGALDDGRLHAIQVKTYPLPAG